MDTVKLESIAQALVKKGKGILAADESSGTIKKRFDTISVNSTVQNRFFYRHLLFTTDGIEDFKFFERMQHENKLTDESFIIRRRYYDEKQNDYGIIFSNRTKSFK